MLNEEGVMVPIVDISLPRGDRVLRLRCLCAWVENPRMRHDRATLHQARRFPMQIRTFRAVRQRLRGAVFFGPGP